MRAIEFPRPVRCHQCTHEFVGAICPLCSTERPSFTALKRITAAASPLGVQPLTQPLPPCRYEPKALCDCEGRGLCLPAA